MSRFETTATIATSFVASIGSHVFCCGLLPLALNASAGALLSSAGAQVGFAIVTALLVASGVTLYERHRHQTVCATGHSCSHKHSKFNLHRHFLRNLLVGGIAYTLFTSLSHLPLIHHGLERAFHI